MSLTVIPARSANFYPRPPRGGRPRENLPAGSLRIFLSTPSARRATGPQGAQGPQGEISIHALREEGDSKAAQHVTTFRCISIHALREEGDSLPGVWHSTDTLFLSTLSARRATTLQPYSDRLPAISIHALREEGDIDPAPGAEVFRISIHALREEGDVV